MSMISVPRVIHSDAMSAWRQPNRPASAAAFIAKSALLAALLWLILAAPAFLTD